MAQSVANEKIMWMKTFQKSAEEKTMAGDLESELEGQV